MSYIRLMKPVKGTKDFFGINYRNYDFILSKFKEHMIQYGFEGIEPSILEHRVLYNATVGDTSDIVAKEMFVVNPLDKVKQENDTVLRPEGTVSVVRALVDAGRIYEKVRAFYAGPMFRYNRPQKGRFRQFTQLGCEAINANHPDYEAEVIACGFCFLKSLGLEFSLRINAIPADINDFREKLQSFFQENRDKLSPMNQARIDVNPMRVLDQLSPEEIEAISPIPKSIDFLSEQDRARFEKVCTNLSAIGVDFVIDQHIVRGLDYYQNTVFEFVGDGQSIGGGGAYVIKGKRFGISRDVFGIGWAMGLDRFDTKHITLPKISWTIVAALDEIYGAKVAQILRKRGHNVITVYDDMKEVIRKANEFSPSEVYFAGPDEAALNTVKVKNWHTRTESIIEIDKL